MSHDTYTKSAPILWRFQCDPQADGSCSVQAFFHSYIVNDSDASDKLTKDGGNVTFALPADLAAAIQALAEAALEAK